jgi:hypothetical protein
VCIFQIQQEQMHFDIAKNVLLNTGLQSLYGKIIGRYNFKPTASEDAI